MFVLNITIYFNCCLPKILIEVIYNKCKNYSNIILKFITANDN